MLDAVAAVHPHLAPIIHPADAKLNESLRLHQSLQQAVLQVTGVALDERPDGGNHLAHRLNELRLMGIALGHLVEKRRLGEGMTHL
ncbi:hypothetical protein D3C80_1757370 [compost metagenome]